MKAAMVDQISTQRRSVVMAAIKSKNTGPEIRVRKTAHSMGLRFRLHRTDLPGNPDLVFPKLNVAVSVHGCFWHQHTGCRLASVPKSRTEYWEAKLRRNVERDAWSGPALRLAGWRSVVIWECETHNYEMLTRILRDRVIRERRASTRDY